MSEPYTPTTEQWKAGREAHRASGTPASLAVWLSEHDRQVAERAWEEGYQAGLERDGYHGPDLNPYRAAKGERK